MKVHLTDVTLKDRYKGNNDKIPFTNTKKCSEPYKMTFPTSLKRWELYRTERSYQ